MGGPIQPNMNTAGARYAAMEPDAKKRAGDAAVRDVPVVESVDRFSLSVEAAELRVSATMVEQSLTGAYAALAEQGDALVSEAFEAAGKTEYMESIAGATDQSAEATAARILGGITGYIFGAFQDQNPEFTEEDFDKFHVAVTEGFEKGLREAADILRSMSVMTNEVSEDIAKTTEIVRSGLAEFYESIADSFGGSDPSLKAIA